MPIIVILLFVVIIGYYAAILLGLLYVFLLAFANVISSMVFGYLVLKLLSRQGEPPVDWQAIVIGVVLLSLIKLIPIVGPLVAIILLLMVLGAIMRIFKQSLTPQNINLQQNV